MSEPKYDGTGLDNQVCFPLYVASRELINLYRPYLDELNLTYTQYIAMMVFWEKKKINLKELGKRLFLDSGTLTPVLKCMQNKGLITRARSTEDERVVYATITPEGEALKAKADEIPHKVRALIPMDDDDAEMMFSLVSKLLIRLAEKDS